MFVADIVEGILLDHQRRIADLQDPYAVILKTFLDILNKGARIVKPGWPLENPPLAAGSKSPSDSA